MFFLAFNSKSIQEDVDVDVVKIRGSSGHFEYENPNSPRTNYTTSNNAGDRDGKGDNGGIYTNEDDFGVMECIDHAEDPRSRKELHKLLFLPQVYYTYLHEVTNKKHRS